jgi:hypothetical protein
MSKFKITFRVDADGENFHATKTLRFLPQIGMQLVIFDGDNFRKVDAVYWHPVTGFEVYFEEDEFFKAKDMPKIGWRVG